MVAASSSSVSAPPLPPAPCASVRVLTDSPLFRLVTSFQRGLPGVVVPLLRRYRAEGHVTFDRAKGTFSNAQLEHCRVPREWARHTMGEAIVFYHDFDVLHTVWRQWGTTHGSRHDRELLHSRLCEAACAFGRLDMLQWLYHEQQDVPMEWSRTSLNVRACTVAGQLHVLEWLDSQFQAHVRGLLQEMNCVGVVKGGHVAVLRWLLERRLGRFPPDTVNIACESGHLDVLQYLVEHGPGMPFRPLALLTTATVAGHLHIVQWLVEDRRTRYTMALVDRALLHSPSVDIAEYLLTQRHLFSPPIEGELDSLVVPVLVKLNALQKLELLVSVRKREKLQLSISACVGFPHSIEVVQLLLPISAPDDVVTTILRLTIRGGARDSVAYLLEHAASLLPATVSGFVDRYQRRALGPLASLIPTKATSAAIEKREVFQAMAAAYKEEICDSALLACVVSPSVLVWILVFDMQQHTHEAQPLRVDVALLQLCRRVAAASCVALIDQHIAWRQNLQ